MAKEPSYHTGTRPRGVSRRGFLKLAAAGTMGLLAGCNPAPQPTLAPTSEPAPKSTATPSPKATPPATETPEPTTTSSPTTIPPVTEVRQPEIIKFYPDVPSKVVHTHHAGVWAGTPTDSALADSAEENNLLVPEALREMLDASIAALTGLDKARDAWSVLFSPEERVAIKVNTFRNSLIWTHVPLVTAVTDSLQEAGVPAGQIVIFDYYTSELEKAGFSINEDGPGVRCYGTGSNYTQAGKFRGMNIELSDTLLECNALINMPVLKSHMMAGISFAMKNHYGSISRPSLFHSEMGNAMAKLNALSPIKDRTRLIVGDALTACLRFRGAYPYWSSDWTGDSILLSFDPVAIDTTALQMLGQLLADRGENPARILAMATPCLEGAAEAGLGTNDLENIDLVELNLG